MAVKTISDTFDPATALRTVRIEDDHGRVMDIQIGVLPSSPQYQADPTTYIANIVSQFAADEQIIANYLAQSNP